MDKFFLRNFVEKVLDFIFPPKCGFCGEITSDKRFVCENCYNLSIQKYTNRCKFCGKIAYSDICIECKNKTIYYDELMFCSEYTDEIKHKIHLYKFKDKKYYYHFFSELIYKNIKGVKADFIVSVPISRERYKERGYNQSELIAKKLSRFLEIPYIPNLLIKTKDTKRQSMQNFKMRKESVKNVFNIADNIDVGGSTLLLIDDIFTTGSTVNECSKVLKKSGAKNIKVAVISISHTLK